MNIKTGPVNLMSVDELVIAQAWLGVMASAIAENGQDLPASFKAEKQAVDKELTERQRSDKEKQLAVLKLRREALSTMEEKRSRADAQIEQLEVELGLTQPKGKSRART